jgi:predicted nucleotidyltransferase
MPRSETMQAIAETMKKAAAAMREAEIPFMLAGSLASWARGGPETAHDLDFVIRPADAERALETLERAGMRTEKPPENWLHKAWDGEVLVDLIFDPSGLAADDSLFERAQMLSVMSVDVPVMALEDVIVTKLNALDEHSLDGYEGLLDMARALREQIEWERVRERTRGLPFADAYFVMLDGLGIVGEPGKPDPRVRVDVSTA